MAGAKKPPRVVLSLARSDAPAPPAGATDEAPVEVLDEGQRAFIRGAAEHRGAPQGAAEHSAAPQSAAKRRGVSRWTDGTEARKHSVYLPVELSERLLAICKAEGLKASKAFEQAIEAWVEGRGRY